MKDLIKGTIITLIIGGTAYTFSQGDVVKHFAEDTGLSQEQAEQYVNEVSDDELIAFDKLGSGFVDEGQEFIALASEIDCVNYEYEWESALLSCQKGKVQMNKLGKDSVLLGQAYIKLASDSSSKDDITMTIPLIDQLNADYQLEVVGAMLNKGEIDEIKKTNSYNKALLKAALESDKE